MRWVHDSEDPALADYLDLTDATARRLVESPAGDAPHGILVAEGGLAIRQLLASGLEIRSVVVTPERAGVIDELTEGHDVQVVVAPRAILATVTGYDVHRGLLASANRPAPHDPERLVAAHDRLVLVEAVNDNENVGSLFRNVAGLGLGAVVLDRRCADPFYRRSIRVSSGWTLRVPHARVPSLDQLSRSLREHKVRIVALSPAVGGVAVDRAAASGLFDGPLALMVGSEGHGLDARSLELADACVSIPMQPEVDSLNVATALAVVGAFCTAHRGWDSP